MIFKNIIRVLYVVCIGVTTATFASEQARPNIVFILLDDLGYADVGFTQHSEPDIYTPSIDALANDGVVFTQAYVTHPYCGPSRAGLMTGRYQHEYGGQFNLADYSESGVPIEEVFFSRVLQDSGYRTGLIGKWHLGSQPQYRPNVRGFDYFYGMLGGGHVYHTNDFVRVSNYDSNNTNIWEYKIPLMENDQYAPETNYDNNLYITDMLTDAGINFINETDTDDDPFFLFMSYNAPHTPEEAKENDEQTLLKVLGKNAAKDPKRLTYTAMVYAVDRGIERIVNALKQKNVYDNTLIVFLSDNGGRLNNASAKNTPLRDGKSSVFEGGIRVPMFWHWPKGNLPQGTYNYVVSSLDFYPTFTQLANANMPKTKQLDGINILSDVRNSSNAREQTPLYFMAHNPNAGINLSAVVLNDTKWFSSGNGQWQFFDLKENIGEDKTSKASLEQKEMIDALFSWSCKHIRPAWFDDKKYNWEQDWAKNAMPNWARTFPVQYKHSGCSVQSTMLVK